MVSVREGQALRLQCGFFSSGQAFCGDGDDWHCCIGLHCNGGNRCGGTVRQGLAVGSEDVALLNRARRHSDRIVRAERMVVYSSLRRLRAWGARRTLLWHWDRRYRPADESGVHVRAVR